MRGTAQLARFGVFDLDLNAGELCRNGRRIRLQEQPFRLLSLLLERPGDAVSREELRKALDDDPQRYPVMRMVVADRAALTPDRLPLGAGRLWLGPAESRGLVLRAG